MLTRSQVEAFVEHGFVRLEGAFPRAIADAGLEALCQAIGCDPDDRTTWTRPVVRVWPENDWRGDPPLSSPRKLPPIEAVAQRLGLAPSTTRSAARGPPPPLLPQWGR